MDNMKHYKFIHLLGHNELKFTTNIVLLISDPENGFDPEEHLFITPYEAVYEALSRLGNVRLAQPVSRKNGYEAAVINNYTPYCDFMIVHMMCQPVQALKIKPAYRKKIVWRSWGSDTAYQYYKGKLASNAVKFLIHHTAWRHIVRSFPLIGIANTVDILDITRRFGKRKMLRMPYAKRGRYDELCAIREAPPEVRDTVNVMVGHSGSMWDRHIPILESLKRFQNENIRIFLPLSYGKDVEYVQSVREYVSREWGNQVCILDSFLPYEEYAKIIRSMDIAIFDGKNSHALGNIGLFLFFGKKIFLNRDGAIRRAFAYEGIPCCCTDEIGAMSFDTFAAPLPYTQECACNLAVRPFSQGVEDWKTVFAYLDSIQK